jgi:hypothetical protein
MFYKSYSSVESVIEEWRPPGPGMLIPYDDAADVILDMFSRENRYCPSSPSFPSPLPPLSLLPFAVLQVHSCYSLLFLWSSNF